MAGVFTWDKQIHTTLMNVTDDAWYDEQHPTTPQTIPQAVCIDGQCSVGATSRGQLFISELLPCSHNGGDIPVFSVDRFTEPNETETKYYIGHLSILGSTNADDNRKIWIQKDRVDPNQPVGFNIVTGNGTSGVNVFVGAQANLTTNGSTLDYQITATASSEIPGVKVTPQIWEKTDAGDVLVYTGTLVTCSAAKTCIATGTYTPSDAATYFANATVLYTVPAVSASGVAAGTQNYISMVASGGDTYKVFVEGIDVWYPELILHI